MKKILYDTEHNYLFFEFQAHDANKLLTMMSEVLISEKYVKPSYKKAVIKREAEFPTGLPTRGTSVAIPHTEGNHVLREGILVGILENPVTFEVMASPGEYVEVEIVFMLAIKESKNQLLMLQKLVELCQNEKALKILKEGKQLAQIDEILKGIM